MSLAEQFAKDAGEAASQASLSSMFQQDVQAKAPEAAPTPARDKTSVLGAIGAGLGHGAGGTILGAQQLLGKGLQQFDATKGAGDWLVSDANQGINKLDAQFKGYQEDHPVAATGADIAGTIGATAPLGLVAPIARANGIVGVAARSGLQGGLAGALQPVVGDENQENFAQNKLQQVAAGTVLGAAGGAAGDTIAKGVGAAANKLKSAVGSITSNFTDQTRIQVEAMQHLADSAQKAGIDLSSLPQPILDSVKQQTATALSKGMKLDAAAAIRKAEGDAVLGDAGLTLGQATRDPGQFTQEMNLRGVQGAGAPLMQRFSDQNNALIGAMNAQGAAVAPGAFQVGGDAIKSIAARDASKQATVSGLYSKAEQIGGGNVPLDVDSFVKSARQNLTDQMRDLHLPSTVSKRLDMFESGQTPLTVGTSEQFKSILAQDIANAQARGRGNEVHALNIVRDALNDTSPLLGGVADQGSAAMQAFNTARAAARERFGEIDSVPALKAVVNGKAVPDDFFQTHVINGDVGDVKALLGIAPDQSGAIRNQVVAYLKDKALGGASDEVGKFSQSGYNKALTQLGDAKLSTLFAPEDVARLKQIGRVASYVQSQPAGAAVNNSNTAAAVMNLFSQIAGNTGKLPGINILRNSYKSYKDEKSATNALQAAIRPTAAPSANNPLRALLPGVAPAAGAFGAQSGQ